MIRQTIACAAATALIGIALPATAQSCLGLAVTPTGPGGVLTPSVGRADGGTELGIVSGYAFPTGTEARLRLASARFGEGLDGRQTFSGEVAHDIGRILWGNDAPPISLCPAASAGRMRIGSLTETAWQLSLAVAADLPLGEETDWTLHPYGSLGSLRSARTMEGFRRSEVGVGVRAGVLAARGRIVGGVETEHAGVFSARPSLRLRLGLRF